MVIIYVDVLIFTNMLINYCILSLAKKFLHAKSSEIRIIFASFVGALCTLTVFLPVYNEVFSYVIKLFISTIICFIAYSYIDIRTYIKNVIAVFCISVIFCGAMLLIYQGTKPKNMAIVNDIVYFQIKPITLILISVVNYLIVRLVQNIFRNETSGTIAKIKFTVSGQCFSCIGKIDTGCSVVEPFSNAPVIIIESSIINIDGERIIPYSALGTSGILKGIKAEKVEIDNQTINKEVYIGIFNGNIDNNVKAIISSEILRW